MEALEQEKVESPEKQVVSESLAGMFKDRAGGFFNKVQILGMEHPTARKLVVVGALMALTMVVRTPDFDLLGEGIDMGDELVKSIEEAVSPQESVTDVDPNKTLYAERWNDPGPHGDAWSSGDEAGGALKQETLVDSKIGAETAVSDKPSVPPASLDDQINTGRDDLYDFNPRKIPDNPLVNLQDIDRGQQGEIEPPYDLEKRIDIGFRGGEEEVEMAGGAPDEPAERTITRETIETGASETPETAKLGRVIAPDMVETSSVVGKERLKPFEMGDVVKGETPKTVEIGEVVKGHQPKTVEMGESGDAGGRGSSKIARIGKLFNKIKGS